MSVRSYRLLVIFTGMLLCVGLASATVARWSGTLREVPMPRPADASAAGELPATGAPGLSSNLTAPPHRPGRARTRTPLKATPIPSALAAPRPMFSKYSNDLIERADMIVIGTVESRVGKWNAERTHIYTAIDLNIEEHLRGSGPARLIEPGGTVGADSLVLHDAGIPQFESGERVLLFLKRGTTVFTGPVEDAHPFYVMYGYMGKFGLQKDASGIEQAVSAHPETGEKHEVIPLSAFRDALQ